MQLICKWDSDVTESSLEALPCLENCLVLAGWPDHMAETTTTTPSILPIPAIVQPKQTRHELQIAPPFVGMALAAASALILHFRRNLKRDSATRSAIAELKAERDLAQKQLQVKSTMYLHSVDSSSRAFACIWAIIFEEYPDKQLIPAKNGLAVLEE